MSQDDASTEVFKALSDPVRWEILQQIAAVEELACATLEQTLPVSKPTISYHTKILQQVGLLAVRKEGRNYYYTLRREPLQIALDDLVRLAPAPRPVLDGEFGSVTRAGRRDAERAHVAGRHRERRVRRPAGDDEAVVLTW